VALPIQVRRGLVAVLLLIALVLQGTTSVLAGTTGSISGVVVDPANNQPVADARVSATSPSQLATTTTDSAGRFTFASLAPDTYTVTVAATANRDVANLSGVTVQADQNLNLTLTQPTKLQNIGHVTSRSASSLVKPGTTADVYSISAVQQDKASNFGGGGTLNSAWSAISSVPGVFITPNQNGYIGAGPGVSIRGGDYDQIGYELDGVPVNRSFDNYPSSVLSSLGQQEVQVYTGAAPANAEANSISGYINQVIRTGTAPASTTLDLAAGSPTLYNKVSLEVGGANPSRTFSYYFGAGAYNQGFRYYDQSNGAGLSNTWGPPIAPCGVNNPAASCHGAGGADYANPDGLGNQTTPAYVLGPYNAFSQAYEQVRDTVLNLHFGLPQKSGNKDDIQVLFDMEHIGNFGYDSPNDLGGDAYLNAIGLGAPFYVDTHETLLPYGTLFPVGYGSAGQTAGESPYFFPFSGLGRALGSNIGGNTRDEYTNDQSIIKVQYQHNFGTNAYLRVYGYTYYSDWLNNGPNSTYSDYVAYDSPDYELNSHTRGVSLQFSDQITPSNLLSLQGSYTTANSTRYNNSFYGIGGGTTVGYLVNGSNPGAGICYSNGTNVAAGPAGTPITGCNYNPAVTGGTFGQSAFGFTANQAVGGTIPQPGAVTCGGGPCQYLLVAGGPSASFNQVVPKFTTFSVTDNWTPTSKLTVNVGLRFDQFQFLGTSTQDSVARTLFFNAYDMVNTTSPLFNVGNNVDTFDEYQPRAGLTYTVNPTTVVRASYGRYAEAPNTAFEQYNYLQPNSLGPLISFANLGLGDTPGHNVRPEVSNNYDLSFEHQFSGDVAVKLSPFLRNTQDQIQQFYLDQKTSFVSGLNVGHQTSKGIELEIDKGDFARNGVAAKLSFAYTNNAIKYDLAPNGTSVVTAINTYITGYNAYTKAGGGSPCYTTAGGAAPACPAGTIANPYYNAPAQALLDQNASYPTFDIFPGGPESSYSTYGAPYVMTLLVQYKHDRLAITPALQLNAGQRYGAPITELGIQPDACGGFLPGSTVGDPRYKYGAVGGSPYDATTCSQGVAIPDTFTNNFDGIGGFVGPTQLQLHLQASYDLSKRVTLVANFANIVNTCFGGQKVPFQVSNACTYGTSPGGAFAPIGNAYNPGAAIQPAIATPYFPYFAGFPFNMYFEARIKI
jgi:hypothetical protein